MKHMPVIAAAAFVTPLFLATVAFAERPVDRCVSNCMNRRCPQLTAEKWVCADKVRSSCTNECLRDFKY